MLRFHTPPQNKTTKNLGQISDFSLSFFSNIWFVFFWCDEIYRKYTCTHVPLFKNGNDVVYYCTCGWGEDTDLGVNLSSRSNAEYICMIYINACILNPSDFLNLQRFVHNIKPTFNVNHTFYHNENKGFFFFTYSFIVMHKN